MGLSKKTFFYSMTIAAVMVAFVIGYFVFMLPSLYVDYVMKSNLDSVVKLQEGYIENRSYDDLKVENPSSVYTLEVPNEGTNLYVTGKFFKVTLEIKDAELKEMLNRVRDRLSSMENLEHTGEAFESIDADEFTAGWENITEKFAKEGMFFKDDLVAIQMERKDSQSDFREEYTKFHIISDNSFVCEAGISDDNYEYTNYIAITDTEDAYIITIFPTLTPRMDEIRPVVLESLPMIVAVVFLLVLISSRFFSGKIVNPIIRLAGYAESAQNAQGFEVEAFDEGREDEIGALGRALQELYEKLRDNYLELERKNSALEEENTRQEVFLRASSHQLKTPIAAALLLVEGMMNEIGKYKDTKEYLPEVKKQLLSMRKIVEDILYLNDYAEHMQKEEIAVKMLVEETVRAYAVQMEDKDLHLKITGDGTIRADREMMKIIVDNLLANAVSYTPGGEEIEIKVSEKEIDIQNKGITIDEKLLPNIFEPFVSSDSKRKGKGLGLYVASYYSRILGYRLKIENVESGVRARLIFSETAL